MRKRAGIQGGHTELDVQCNTVATGDQPRSRGTAALGGLKMEVDGRACSISVLNYNCLTKATLLRYIETILCICT